MIILVASVCMSRIMYRSHTQRQSDVQMLTTAPDSTRNRPVATHSSRFQARLTAQAKGPRNAKKFNLSTTCGGPDSPKSAWPDEVTASTHCTAHDQVTDQGLTRCLGNYYRTNFSTVLLPILAALSTADRTGYPRQPDAQWFSRSGDSDSLAPTHAAARVFAHRAPLTWTSACACASRRPSSPSAPRARHRHPSRPWRGRS